MFDAVIDHIWTSTLTALKFLGYMTYVFFTIALLAKGRKVFADMRAALPEARINLGIYSLDLLFLSPILVPLPGLIERAVASSPLQIVTAEFWNGLPEAVTLLAVLLLGDLIGYVRHRIEHWGPIWPAHAVHHSDTRMTWLTLLRFHPLSRAAGVTFDVFFLAVLGFPAWAVIFFSLVRFFYGSFTHMDLPWTYGPLRGGLVSPAMHRWHHVLDGPGVGKNFAAMFAFYDRLGGTYYMPGRCDVPLGVTEDMGRGAIGQILHPFKVWGRALFGPRGAS